MTSPVSHMRLVVCADSSPAVVRGPYCATQRKCRHSRGQDIHWSEYRLSLLLLLSHTVSALFPSSRLSLSLWCYLDSSFWRSSLWSTVRSYSILSLTLYRPFLSADPSLVPSCFKYTIRINFTDKIIFRLCPFLLAVLFAKKAIFVYFQFPLIVQHGTNKVWLVWRNMFD